MNQANTLALVAIVLFMASLANVLCFGTSPSHLGGWGPAGMMVFLPLAAYLLGRIWTK